MKQLVRRWARGWGLCRGLAPALDRETALQLTLDLPGRTHEIFTLTDRPEVIDDFAIEITKATTPTWLTVTTNRPHATTGVLKQAGLKVFAEPSLLMSIDLQKHPAAAAPTQYRIETAAAGPLERISVIDAQGNIAARGMAAIIGTDAVVHDIHTDPEHRRRGLGSVVMADLSHRAADRGATTGLLMATAEGGRLYESLDWLTEATMLTATSR